MRRVWPFYKLSNSKGFTLIEIITGLGIAALTTLLAVRLTQRISTSVSTVEKETALSTMRANILAITRDKAKCSANFVGLNLATSNQVDKLFLDSGAKKTFAEIGKAVSGGGTSENTTKYVVKDMRVENFQPIRDDYKLPDGSFRQQGLLDFVVEYGVRRSKDAPETITAEKFKVLAEVQTVAPTVSTDNLGKVIGDITGIGVNVGEIAACTGSVGHLPLSFCKDSIGGELLGRDCSGLDIESSDPSAPALTLQAPDANSLAVKTQRGLSVGSALEGVSIGKPIDELVFFFLYRGILCHDWDTCNNVDREGERVYKVTYSQNDGSFTEEADPDMPMVEIVYKYRERPVNGSKMGRWFPEEGAGFPDEPTPTQLKNARNWLPVAMGPPYAGAHHSLKCPIASRTPGYNVACFCPGIINGSALCADGSATANYNKLQDGRLPQEQHDQVVELMKTGEGAVIAQHYENVGLIRAGEESYAPNYAYQSDFSLKRNIVPVSSDIIEGLLKLPSFSFEFKKMKGKFFGFMAQDVEKVSKKFVDSEDKSSMSVDYFSMMAPLIEAVKNNNSKLDKIEMKLNALEEESK